MSEADNSLKQTPSHDIQLDYEIPELMEEVKKMPEYEDAVETYNLHRAQSREMREEASVKDSTLVKDDTPEKDDTPLKDDAPDKNDTSLKDDTTDKNDTPISKDLPPPPSKDLPPLPSKDLPPLPSQNTPDLNEDTLEELTFEEKIDVLSECVDEFKLKASTQLKAFFAVMKELGDTSKWT